jgi:hypothetical protein
MKVAFRSQLVYMTPLLRDARVGSQSQVAIILVISYYDTINLHKYIHIARYMEYSSSAY